MIKHDSITSLDRENRLYTKKAKDAPHYLLPLNSPICSFLRECWPACPNKLCTRTNVLTPDSLGQVLPSKSISNHQNSGAPSELMYDCILMKFIKMVISLCAVVHLISRRHAAAHISLCVRSSHTPLMNYLLKSVFVISFGWFLHQWMLAPLPTLHFRKYRNTENIT